MSVLVGEGYDFRTRHAYGSTNYGLTVVTYHLTANTRLGIGKTGTEQKSNRQ